MSDYFGVSPEGYQKPLYLANNLSDVVDTAAARTNLGVASADDVLKAANPIGTIISFYGAVAPYGYLPCSGQTISSTTFPALVTFLGGTTSATLPDLRGEFLRGWDNGRGVDVSRSIRTLQLDSLQNIVGTLTDANATLATGAFNYTSVSNDAVGGTGRTLGPITFDASRVARTSTETRPRNVSVLYCIKAYDTPVSATTLNLTSLINEFQVGRSVTSFANLKSSATGLSSLVSITADEVVMKTAATQYRTFTNISVSINTAIVGLNGLDTGTLAVSTWYSTWVISDGTNVAGLISTSATSPTLPAGYTYKARTGWIRTDANASNKFPLSFIQAGRQIDYAPVTGTNVLVWPVMASGVAGVFNGSAYTPIAVGVSSFIPSTAIRIRGRANCSTNVLAQLAVSGESGTYTGSPAINPPQFGGYGYNQTSVWTVPFDILLKSSNIFWAASDAGCYLRVFGWEDSI